MTTPPETTSWNDCGSTLLPLGHTLRLGRADRPEISRATYDSIVDRAYARYPTSEALVAVAVARGREGA